MFRGNMSEAMGQIEPVVTSPTPKMEYKCTCGAVKFRWLATVGRLISGGFQPEEYIYECVGCGRKVTEQQVKDYFARA